jgi:hypothetical protein
LRLTVNLVVILALLIRQPGVLVEVQDGPAQKPDVDRAKWFQGRVNVHNVRCCCREPKNNMPHELL